MAVYVFTKNLIKLEIKTMNDRNSTKINEIVKQSITTISKIEFFSENIIEITNHIVNAISVGKKVIIFGNGGSAADAQHIAAELIGRFFFRKKKLSCNSINY